MQNKYDTNITLEDNSSLTYMLKNIKPGSTVLEFGPATGYMTRYLKEEMQCHVYIVEIDADAFEKASVYAEDGICGSAEEEGWCERFKNIRFDYITFADVLEHLVNPWQVLEWAVQLLAADTGKVLVSIPNIGHNAVLVDLFNNKFEYRRTGIMDNTHLRFFTHDSAEEMFRKCGLHVVDEDAVVFNLEYAGFHNSQTDVPENVWRELQLREYGFVNQFLFTLATSEPVAKSEMKNAAMIYECALYYAKDAEYCEEQKVLGTVQVSGNQFWTDFSLDGEIEAKRIMIELFSFPGTISDLKIECNMPIEQIQPIEGTVANNQYCFWGGKIKLQLEYEKPQHTKYVRISGKLGTVMVRQLGEYIAEMEQEETKKLEQEAIERQRLNEVIEEKLGIIHELGQTVREREQSLEEKERVIQTQAKLLEEKETFIKVQAKTLEEKEKLVEMQVKLLEEKDAFIEKIKSTRWFRMFKKMIMKDR